MEKHKEYSSLKDNIGSAGLGDNQLISKYDKGFLFSCVTGIYSKYTWVVLLKDKKFITLSNAFRFFLSESGLKLTKIWVDKDVLQKLLKNCWKIY